MSIFIYVVEYSFSERRGFYGTVFWLIAPVSYSTLALCAYLIREWRYLMLVGALMSIPVMIFIW